MMHLLDTGVVWELRAAKAGNGDAGVARWAAAQPRTGLFISVLTITELGLAAQQVARSDKSGALAIRRWVDDRVLPAFEGRVLPVDVAVARRAAEMGYLDRRDGLFAATALEHGLTLATRDPGAFKPGRVKTVSPWRYAPDTSEEAGDWRDATRTGPLWLKNLFVRG